MKTIISILILAMAISTLVAAKEPAQPVTAEIIQVLRISQQDERAVIKVPDGKIQIIKVGDLIGKTGKVVEITAGRIVIEEKNDKETEKVIIRLIDEKQKIERMKKAGEKQPMLYAPGNKQSAVSVQQSEIKK